MCFLYVLWLKYFLKILSCSESQGILVYGVLMSLVVNKINAHDMILPWLFSKGHPQAQTFNFSGQYQGFKYSSGDWRSVHAAAPRSADRGGPHSQHREQVQDQRRQHPLHLPQESGQHRGQNWRRHVAALLQWGCFLDAGKILFFLFCAKVDRAPDMLRARFRR